MLMVFVVTLRFQKQTFLEKITGACPTSPVCSDSKGEHHSFIVHAHDWDTCRKVISETFPGIHVTRIEEAKEVWE